MSLAPFATDLLGRTPTAADRETRLAGAFGGEHVLLPLLAPTAPAAADQVEVAATLARASDATLSVVNPVPSPATGTGTGTDTSTGTGTETDRLPADSPEEGRGFLNEAIDRADADGSLTGHLLYTRDVVGGVLRAVRTQGVDTLVLPGSSDGSRLRRGVTESVAAHADCDVVVVGGESGYDGVVSMLLPVAGGPHSGLAADVARAVAEDCGAWVDILHVVPEDPSDRRRSRARRLVDETYHRVGRPETTTTWILEADDVAGTIAEQSRYYGLTILGAPTKGRLHRLIHGSTNHSVRAGAESVVLSARNNGGGSTAGRVDSR